MGPYVQIVVGGDDLNEFACGLRPDGAPECWRNETASPLAWLSEPPPGVVFRRLAAGTSSVCGVRTDGGITCWGSPASVGRPYMTAPAGEFVDVATGGTTTCGIRTSGAVECWSATPHALAQDLGPSARARALAAAPASDLFCALLEDGTPFCRTKDSGFPDPPNASDRFSALSVGRLHVCGVTTDRRVVCWSNGAAPAVTTPPPGLRTPG